MKKLYTLLLLIVALFAKAQIVTIPDANFKAKLIALGVDTNTDGEIQTSEALAQTSLNLSNTSMATPISDLTGLDAFLNLQHLECRENTITSLDLSGLSNLQYVDCIYNHMTSLNLNGLINLQTLICHSNNIGSLNVNNLINLQTLNCNGNDLTSLNVSNLINLQNFECGSNYLTSLNVSSLTNLQRLVCANNQILSLNLSPLTNLTYLNLDNNHLTSLNVTALVNLTYLNASNNLLTSLNVTTLTHLETLICYSNQITTLDFTGLSAITILRCNNNNLPSLDVSFLYNLQDLECMNNQIPSLNLYGLVNLTRVYCHNNMIPSLDLTGLVNIQELYCSSNQITTLDLSAMPNLYLLNCSDNQLTSLFIKNGYNETYLFFENNPNLTYICADDEQLSVVLDKVTQYGYTNCTVNSYCSFTPGGTFYTIQGNNRYDSNNNGCDSADIIIPNLKLTFSDGIHTGNLFSDTTGAYHNEVLAGTHIFSPVLEIPEYFTVSPTTANVTFPTAASPFVQDFCISANGIHNDLETAIIPINRARPGFNAVYKILYKNNGTHPQSGMVNLVYDDSVLNYVSATPNIASQTTNNLIWNFINLAPFETRTILLTLNLNSSVETPPLNAGDILNYSATATAAVDETPLNNTATLHQTLVNSLDPNDKTCLEGAIISSHEVGEYVHYLIRFENTGTANAQNIVVKDMIDASKLEMSTLVPLSGSALYITRITNTNQVEFIFENIDLPFDDANNDGYVAFKIRTKPTLAEGDTFNNTASIFFDYNAPILTNTYMTTVTDLITQDFDFDTYFSVYPVPAKNILNITTKQKISLSSVSIYNTLGQLIQVITNPTEAIDVSDLKTGSYFIKIVSDKGTSSSKFIKE